MLPLSTRPFLALLHAPTRRCWRPAAPSCRWCEERRAGSHSWGHWSTWRSTPSERPWLVVCDRQIASLAGVLRLCCQRLLQQPKALGSYHARLHIEGWFARPCLKPGTHVLALALMSTPPPSHPPRNRHWRMSFCCKGGKAAVLRPTSRFATAPGSGTSNAHVFLDTLVCNVSPSARLLQMPDPLPILGGGGRGPVAAAAVLPAGGLRVAWKHDPADATLPPDQLAGGQGEVSTGPRAGLEVGPCCPCRLLWSPALLALLSPWLLCGSCLRHPFQHMLHFCCSLRLAALSP